MKLAERHILLMPGRRYLRAAARRQPLVFRQRRRRRR